MPQLKPLSCKWRYKQNIYYSFSKQQKHFFQSHKACSCQDYFFSTVIQGGLAGNMNGLSHSECKVWLMEGCPIEQLKHMSTRALK